MKIRKQFMALVALFSLFAAVPAKASDNWPCEVLLCLAASAGTPQECVPALDRLWDHLRNLNPFPVCTFANVPVFNTQNAQNAPGTHIRYGYAFWDERNLTWVPDAGCLSRSCRVSRYVQSVVEGDESRLYVVDEMRRR